MVRVERGLGSEPSIVGLGSGLKSLKGCFIFHFMMLLWFG
jgi:hypothetical protein